MKNDYIAWKLKLIKAENGEGLSILPYIKKRFGYLRYCDAINSIMKNVNYKDYFTYELFPKNINSIITLDYIPSSINSYQLDEASIINEVECFLSLFYNFKDELLAYSKHRNDFEIGLFSGKYKLSQQSLNSIERSFGNSFWLVESKFLLSNYTMNVVESENFYQDLKDKCSDYYIKSFIRSLRRKTNLNESVKDSIAFINKKQNDFSILSNSVEQEKQIYFKFYNDSIGLDGILSLSFIYSLLCMATRLNLIDMFLLIEKIIVHIICDGGFLEKRERLLSVLHAYQLPFLFKKSSDMINNHIDFNDKLTHTIYRSKRELQNHTNFDKCFWERSIEEFPSSFDLIVSYSKMQILNIYHSKIENSLLNLLVEIIITSTLKEGDYNIFSKISNDAIRLKMLLGSMTLNFGYSHFYNDTFNADTSQLFKAVFTSDYYNRNIFFYLSTKNNLDMFNNIFGNYESDWGHSIKSNVVLFYDEITVKLMQNHDNVNDLENLHKKLENDSSPMNIIVDNRCCEKLFYLYLKKNKIQQAIDLYVDLQFKSKFKVICFNNEALAQKCNGIILPALYKNLNFCIYAHLTDFRGALGFRFNNQCANSLMAILKSQNITFPSELTIEPNISKLQKSKYAYLFRHICETDLLTSRLVANGVNTEDIVEQTKIILEERIKLLNLALTLDCEDEKDQIKFQIEVNENEMDSLGNVSLEDTLISYAKILENAVCVSDTEFILPFYNGLKRIISQIDAYNFRDPNSGEFLLFRDLFVRYKKEYIKCLDQQIGINIRHGFLKNEILSYFSKYNILFERFPRKEVDLQKSIADKFNKIKHEPELEHMVNYIDNMVIFSKRLYAFIDELLTKITINHISVPTEEISQVYISDECISKIAYCLLETNNPYDFKDKLNRQMSNIFDKELRELGEYVEKAVTFTCIQLIDECFNDCKSLNSKLENNLNHAKSNLTELTDKIKRWFEYIKDGNKICSLNKYFSLLQKKYSYVNCSLSDKLPEEINFYQLHCLDLILSNLIMNAEEHSGLNLHELIVNTSVSIYNNIMKIYFSNNLNCNIEEKDLLTKMKRLEDNFALAKQNKSSHKGRSKGNGFNHIVECLNSLIDTKWNISFCKNELPKHFALIIEIDWRNYIA